MSEETRKTIALINRGELPALSNNAEVTGGEFGLQPRYDSERFMKIEDYFETIRMGKRRLGAIIVETFIIIGLVIALLFLSNARNEAMEKAEAMQAAVKNHEAYEAEQAVESEKVKVSAKAAAERYEQSATNMAEMQELLKNMQTDNDLLLAERNTLREEVETLRAQIGENPYKDITLSDEERSLFRWILALEAKDEPEAGRKAVAEVVLNRVIRRDWKGETVEAILTADGQFSTLQPLLEYWNGSREKLWAYPDGSEDEIIDYVLTHGRTILPEDYVFFATYKANGKDFIQIGNHYFARG